MSRAPAGVSDPATPKVPTSFKEMDWRQLRAYLDGCHRDKCYDEQFRAAAQEWNSRTSL